MKDKDRDNKFFSRDTEKLNNNQIESKFRFCHLKWDVKKEIDEKNKQFIIRNSDPLSYLVKYLLNEFLLKDCR